MKIKFQPVTTLRDLATLDQDVILEGYRAGMRGELLTGEETRAFVHGWRNAVSDNIGETDVYQQALAREWQEGVKRIKKG